MASILIVDDRLANREFLITLLEYRGHRLLEAEEVFDREHLRLLTNQLAHKAEELHAVNQKLEALLELGQHLVSERDLPHLLDAYGRGAREIIGAKWAAVGLVNEDEATRHQLSVSGLDRGTIALVGPLQAN